MKLVDILAQELAEWPVKEGVYPPGQDYCVQSDECSQVFFCGTHGKILLSRRADKTSGVRGTRAEWQAAVDALNAPKVVEWDGEDTPAVGVICEFHESTSGWNSAVVKYSSDHCVVLERDNGYELCIFTVFPSRSVRPIRTAEQVSAEEREKAINLMIDDTSILTGTISDRRTMARQLYDAGYRKEQKPCGS